MGLVPTRNLRSLALPARRGEGVPGERASDASDAPDPTLAGLGAERSPCPLSLLTAVVRISLWL